ncbi:MAG: hypothetical protein Q7T20_10990 [Saprospiraceae bacterium]|nr:hypothetical protein [Saprospiraceae bacterium]
MYQKTVTFDNSELLLIEYYLYQGTKSDAPESARKQFSDPNAPLDSDL